MDAQDARHRGARLPLLNEGDRAPPPPLQLRCRSNGSTHTTFDARAPAKGTLAALDPVGRQQGALAADQPDQCGTGALADAQGGQFGVQACPLPATPLAGASQRPAVEGGEVEDEAAEQADGEGPGLRLAERPRGLGYFFFAASASGCWAAAWARRLATN